MTSVKKVCSNQHLIYDFKNLQTSLHIMGICQESAVLTMYQHCKEGFLFAVIYLSVWSLQGAVLHL